MFHKRLFQNVSIKLKFRFIYMEPAVELSTALLEKEQARGNTGTVTTTHQ